MIVGISTTCYTQYTRDSSICIFFYLIVQHSKFLSHTLQVLYMCTLCDSTNINTIIEFVTHVSGDVFNGGSDSYLQFRDTHAPCLLKLCIPPSNGIVIWWLFPELGAELPLDNCTQTIILNNPVFYCNIHCNETPTSCAAYSRIISTKSPSFCMTTSSAILTHLAVFLPQSRDYTCYVSRPILAPPPP